MATKKQWQEYLKAVKKWVKDLEKWIKKNTDGVQAQDDIGSNPPPPPPPPPGN